MQGIFAIIKPKGPTSHDVVNELRRITKERKIGHAGTLDPLAQGVLVVAVGSSFTKKLKNYLIKEKEYVATIELGKESNTDDEEGIKKVINDIKKPTLKDIQKTLINFQGKIMQVPPQFSAIKINGSRAYQLARKQKNVNLKPRLIEVKNIEIIQYIYPKLVLKIVTGPGVYIRSITRDLGKELETGAYLKELKRTRVGDFLLKNSLTISQLKNKINL